MQKAYAQAQGDLSGFGDKKFINISMSGGPSRWMWDLPLKPNGNDAFKYNTANDPLTSMLITKLIADSTAPGGFRGEYATTQVGDYYLPLLWSGKIATVGGASENMSALAQNMLMMRGIRSVDSHSLGRTQQTKPAGGVSLGGAVADVATTVLPALSYGAFGGYYQSAKGIAPQEMGGSSDPLTNAFAPFNGAMSLKSNAAATAAAIDHALDVMKAKSGDHHKMIPYSYQDRVNARKLMTTAFTGLNTVYTTARDKYLALINRSFGEVGLRLAGVDSLVIPGSAISPFKVANGSTENYYTGSDLCSITDMSTSIGNLAESFAVAEFMFCGGTFNQSFSSSYHIEIGGVTNAILDSIVMAGVTSTNSRIGLTNDAHFTGSFVQMIQFSRYYRALSSCLFELIKQLKAKSVGSGNLFDQTVIAVNAEFNRSARNDGRGADHGPNGSCYTLFSGMISAPLVVGDIKVETGVSSYGGSWGVGAPMPEFVNQQAVVGNAASTVSLMMGTRTPTPNNSPFVNMNPATGKVSSAVSRTKNVA
jgi:hypothetical protein